MKNSLQEWVEAALIVADSSGMADDEVIPTWPAACVELEPGRYPQLTVGALREWRAKQAPVEVSPLGNQLPICPECDSEMYPADYGDPDCESFGCAECGFNESSEGDLIKPDDPLVKPFVAAGGG